MTYDTNRRRNLVTSLFEHEQIKTTLPKARETARLAEKVISNICLSLCRLTIASRSLLGAKRRTGGPKPVLLRFSSNKKFCRKSLTHSLADIPSDQVDTRGYTSTVTVRETMLP